jgi:hypothetical protein
MIPKSGYRFSEKIMLHQGKQSWMAIRRNVIQLESVVTGFPKRSRSRFKESELPSVNVCGGGRRRRN